MTPWGEVVGARRRYEQSIGAELRAHEAALASPNDPKFKSAWQDAMRVKGEAYMAYRDAVRRAIESGIPRPK